MRIKKCLIFILIFIVAVTEVPNASPVATNYKQGIYSMKEVNVVSSAKLLTPNNTTSLIIIDSKSNEKFYKRFDTIDEIINLGFIKDGDTVIIVGSGEIEITNP